MGDTHIHPRPMRRNRRKPGPTPTFLHAAVNASTTISSHPELLLPLLAKYEWTAAKNLCRICLACRREDPTGSAAFGKARCVRSVWRHSADELCLVTTIASSTQSIAELKPSTIRLSFAHRTCRNRRPQVCKLLGQTQARMRPQPEADN